MHDEFAVPKFYGGMGRDIITQLKSLPSGISYDGEISRQVVFKLANGNYLRIGQTEDVDDIWCDEGFTGLFGELK